VSLYSQGETGTNSPKDKTEETALSQPSLGIDVAKRTLQVALLVDGKLKQKSVPNNTEGYQALFTWLQRHVSQPVHACLEATGRYHEAAAEALAAEGHVVSVLNPLIIQRYGQCRMARTKTDPTDAALLAEFCLKEKPLPWKAPSPEVRELQELVRHAHALDEQLQATKNQLQAGLRSAAVVTSLQELVQLLKSRIEAIWKRVKDFVASTPTLKRQAKLLVSIPGVGDKTAAVILAEVQDISRFDDVRQLVAYAGLCPQERQSGTSVRGRPQLSKRGNARLRKALYMPALSAMRWNPLLKAAAERLLARGKCKMAAIGALMRKLLHLAYGVLKNNKQFDPNFATCQST
jgi:transposase